MTTHFKGVNRMRGRLLTYEELVNENKQALLADRIKIEEIELRLEQRQIKLVEEKRKNQAAL